ncbi:hypothetical protein BB559_000438 [Furculomyces boomerangus]|uniref:VWFA domain-containing protein n=2 Tax=Harpellales TaxID=61421 RepID=A0A2T9Z5C3_9FUNG|nr:hypothetical protein BB559_000438 [Furculomyces boomerangus]PVZ98350.1 hypothetical protein BB558_005651 [Smittium angustum]PWA02651.1 hypothetical protein BB558_001219 [Smittium angustum]
METTEDQLLKEQDVGYTWEAEYKRSWDNLQEDESGSLQSAVASLHKKLKLKRKQKNSEVVQRGLIRYCYIIIDCSGSMTERDLRPSRIELALQTMETFITAFFEQNPLSQIGLIITRDGLAEKVTGLSSNPIDHIKAVKSKKYNDPNGSISLQNALIISSNILKGVPNHGSREIIAILGSLTSNDPGDINHTINELKLNRIQVSIVEMSAEVYLFKKVCTETNGTFGVALNEAHFKDLMANFIVPPPILTENVDCHLVTMGFSESVHDSTPTFCVCHHKMTLSGYLCPRCKAKVCSLPTNCDVCGLSLIASPHLSRSYHFLFPTKAFVEYTNM